MKKGIRASVLAFVMVFTFVTSLMGNAMVVRADESTKNVKIAKAIYDGTRLKVTMAGSLKDGTNAFSVVSSDGEEVAIKAVNGKGAIFNIEMEEALNPAKRYHIICGGNSYAITMPERDWHVCINGERAGTESLGKVSGTTSVDAVSALVLVQGENAVTTGSGKGNAEATELVAYLGVAGACIAASIVKKRKR